MSRYLLKEPRQSRARDTIDALLEGTAQLLVEEGWEALNTNRIAERAGVSIGTLYQYFSNKEAMVGLLMERFMDEQLALLSEKIAEHLDLDLSLEARVRQLIAALMETHELNPALSRALFMQVPVSGQIDMLSLWTARSREVVAMGLAMERDRLRAGMDLDLVAYLLVTALHGVVYCTIMDRPELLTDERLIEEVSALTWRYIAP